MGGLSVTALKGQDINWIFYFIYFCIDAKLRNAFQVLDCSTLEVGDIASKLYHNISRKFEIIFLTIYCRKNKY